MKIAFDIDGTVMTQGSPEKDYRDSVALPEMVSLVNQLHYAGHEIYFFTARHFKHFKYTDETLKAAGFKFDGLIMNKPSCDLYVDDKGFRFDNKEQKEELLKLIDGLTNVKTDKFCW